MTCWQRNLAPLLLLSLVWLFLITLAVASSPAKAEDVLVADLSQKTVSITTDFNGAELLLFGAVTRDYNDDIVIIVSGPEKQIAVRRKEKIAGIWLNTESITLEKIPSFYHTISTRRLELITSPELRLAHGIGHDTLPFTLAYNSRMEKGEPATWKQALQRNMQQLGLWANTPARIQIIQKALFRTTVNLPANITPGEYQVRILHFRDQKLINEEASSLRVNKAGLSAQIFSFAHNYAPFYGILAILFAVAAGWLAAVAFRR